MIKHPVCLVLALLAVTGCSPRQKGPGPNPHIAPLAANTFAQQWFNDLHMAKDNVQTMYLRDDTVFVYSQENQAFAIGRRGGELRYIAHPDVTAGTLRAPIIVGDYVIYPSGANLEIFTSNGRQVRTVALEKPTRSGGVVDGGRVFIGLDHSAGRGVLAAIDLNRTYHNTDWELMAAGAMSSAPVIFEKVIYAAAEDGKIYAVDEARKPMWSLPGGSNTFNTQGKFIADLKVDEYGLYASNTDSKLYCIDRKTGKMKWQYYSGAQLNTSPVVFPATVYQYVPTAGIVAIDKANGQYNRQPKWVVKNAKKVLSEDATNTYLADTDGRLMAVDKKTGQTIFTSKSRWDAFATNYTDATIFAVTKDGKLAAVKPILKEGEVGTVVIDFRPEPLALAR